MADEKEEIDLEQIVWDPRYRRRVIERLNGGTPEPALPPETSPSETEQVPPR